jgi:hypothetical protein
MRGAIPPLPNTPSWRGAQLKAQGQICLYFIVKFAPNHLPTPCWYYVFLNKTILLNLESLEH